MSWCSRIAAEAAWHRVSGWLGVAMGARPWAQNYRAVRWSGTGRLLFGAALSEWDAIYGAVFGFLVGGCECRVG
jgi:hypothetical protein